MLYQIIVLSLILAILLRFVFLYSYKFLFLGRAIYFMDQINLQYVFSLIPNILLINFLVNRWITAGYFPLSNLFESLLFLTWCLSSILLMVELKTSNYLIGLIVIPIQITLIGFSSYLLPESMQKSASLVPALQSSWLMFHVSMMILSYAILILGSLLSVLIMFISRRSMTPEDRALIEVSRKRTGVQSGGGGFSGRNENLLINLDTWSYRAIQVGHIALTLGILAGSVWANESWGSYWSWDPKETWSLITWLIFTAYLHARLIQNWAGPKLSVLGAIGFVSIWISYLGVNFLASGLHSYGWIS